ncbi:SDR family NAD(P)-dependent oxidoreductase [Kitasatospora sp. NPDC059160]|uniref:SDR family NAD(P)-dependent oxidoreductase n=1 Tax=Kitasatospora sp. NPDC059160 TaxID=3346748 RepID=UPI0036CE0024
MTTHRADTHATHGTNDTRGTHGTNDVHATRETYEKTFAGREPLIAQHRADGLGLLPAAVQLEMALAGIAGLRPFAPSELTDVAFLRPLTLAEDASAAVRLDVRRTGTDRTGFELSTVLAGERKALSTGTGRLLGAGSPGPTAWQVTAPRTVDPAELYRGWAREGLAYGPDFRTVRELAVGDGTARAVLATDAEPLPWHAHPLLVDGVFQAAACALQDLADGPRPVLPIGLARIAVHAELSGRTGGATVLVRRTGDEGAYATADALLLGPSGEVLVEFTGLRMRRTTGRAAGPAHPLSRIRWRETPGPVREPAGGTWVLLHHGAADGAAGDDPAERTARRLRAEGARVVEAVLGTDTATGGADRVLLPAADEESFRRLWESLGEPVTGVVHLWNTGPARERQAELDQGLHGCLAALRTLGERRRNARFFAVTASGQPVVDGDVPVPARAALWGLVRTAAIEYPGLRPRLIDLDGASADALAGELGDGPTEVAYRRGVRHEPVRVRTRPARPGGRPVRPGGRYLLLGGHGGLGRELAARLAREGAGLVALVSRSGGAGAPAADLPGCTVVSYAADITAPGELGAVVDRIRADFGELHGVVHAAGTLKDGLIRSAAPADLAAVLRPKVDGVHELAAALAGTDLDFAVLFASVSGTFGNLGQAGYAAANAYLDAFAHAHGRPWLSVDWGLWGEVGMGTAVADQLRRRGVRPLGTAEALDALLAVLGEDTRQVVIAHPDASVVLPEDEPAGARLPGAEPADELPAPAALHAGGAGPERVEQALEGFLTERLGLARLDRDAPLSDYGMSSITSVELSEELSRRWGIHLPATLFLEYGGFAELAQALTERYGAAEALPAPTAPTADPDPGPDPAPDPGPAPAAAPVLETAEASPAARPVDRPAVRPGDIAVVAASGDLPGAADQDGLWALLRAGGHAFTEIPADRWDIDAHFGPRAPRQTGTYCRTGAFLTGIDRFDPAFFGVSVREAEELDVQQKLLLEHAWAVRDESGLADRRDIGVFVGATYTHHRDAQGLDSVGPYSALGSMNALLANRISYALDLRGPSQTVDTLCSSALVAVQQAVAALRAGHCGAAIVAACHVGLTPWYYRSLSQLGALSEGLPRPFDARADGFVPGEGAVAVMLKPLADAERDGDRVLGVIRGAAVNHGGRAGALPVPRSEAQTEVIRAALADAGVAPAEITLIEAHGTATQLGDPIETAALAAVFGADPDRRAPCHLGSVKANIGHLEPAAGLAGLLKVLLCLRHREIPPLAGFDTPSAQLDLADGTFVIPTEPVEWSGEGPRRAGISAFGMGGTNAHLVVEEYLPQPADRTAAPGGTPEALGEHLLVLSGHTPEALAHRAADVLRLLRGDTPTDLAALCRSAAVGRDHRRHRLAVLGATAGELAAGLARHLRDGQAQALRGDAPLEGAATPADEAFLDLVARFTTVSAERLRARLPLPEQRLSTALALHHVGGGTVDWRAVHQGAPARRTDLPPYPFRAPAETARRLTRAHRVLGEPTVPGALPLALALHRAHLLHRAAFLGRGTGEGPLGSDLDDPARTGAATFRHGGRTIARIEPAGPDTAPARAPRAADLDALRARLGRTLEPDGLYAWFAAKGMDLDAPLRSLGEVRYGPDRVLARVDLPEAGPLERTVVALDAALQSMAVLTLADPSAAAETYLPESVRRVERWGDPARTAYVLLEAEDTGTDRARRGDATLLAADGAALARLTGVEYRTAQGPRASAETAAAETAAAGTAAAGTAVAGSEAPVPVRTVPDGHGAAVEAAVLAIVRDAFRDPAITATTPLSTVGLDSLLATAVAADLEAARGLRLSPGEVLEHPDCRSLAAYLAGQFPAVPVAGQGADGTAEPAEAPAVTEPEADSKDIAVIGFALALPGARDEDALWSLLADAGSALGPAPAHRWNGSAAVRTGDVGGFLDNVEEFDARFFDFFPKQAEVLDPQVRWLLRTTWEALESAGLPPRGLDRDTGVFVGASYQHYREYNLAPELDAHSGLGNHNAFLANRLSHFLDLRGPSMTIDTLCSSSLVALHTAVRSLRVGECGQAIVAGVRVGLSPLHYTAMTSLRALSPTGLVRAFDATADGFVPGEGVVSVVLKPLAAALRDGDRIRGVIRGSAVNHGGRTSGLTVPSSSGQEDVVASALREAGVSPESIGLVEAHGTGTKLGDPIEVEGLTRAWREHTDRAQFCALGSVKSNIGHLEPAAGLAGLVKVLLAMEHGTIPPSLHVRRPNDHVTFESSPFYLADRARPWPRGEQARRAAVSSFGMGGVNAHVIVEEPPALPVRAPLPPGSHLVRVTAADENTVRTLAAAYAERFEAVRDPWETADLCRTANTGRSPQEWRTAVHGRDAAELATALRAVAAGRVPVTHADQEPAAAAERSALGIPGARTIDLPTYPFAPDTYWRTRTGEPRTGEAPRPTGAQALRTAWHSQEPAAATAAPTVASGTVRLVGADRALGQLIEAELRARGARLAEPGRAADTVLMIDASDDADGGDGEELGPFWKELGDQIRELPPHGRILWAGCHSAAVHPGERAALRPVRAAEAAAVAAACAESRRSGAIVHLDAADPAEAWARQLADEYAALGHGPDAPNGEHGEHGAATVVAYRGGVRYAPQSADAAPGPNCGLSGDGYLLVTGGLGAVGRRLVARLIERGARRIGIVGRSPLDPGRSAALRELAGPAEVAYRPCDTADASALAAVADELGARWGRLRGVVHGAGGVNPFGAMHRRPWGDAARVLAPKVAGSLNAVRLAQQRGADFAVLVSSIAGAQARAGRGLVDYALANAYQLALAERENGTAGTTVTAHAWPDWTGVGMAADASFAAAHAIDAGEAEAAFLDHALTGGAVLFPGRATATAQPVPAPTLAPEPAPIRVVIPAAVPATVPAAPAPVTGRDRTAAREAVRAAFVQVLGEDPGERALPGLGLDSLAIAELATALERHTGRTVDPSLLMRTRTADDLAAVLAAELAVTVPAQPGPDRPVPAPDADGRSTALRALLRPLVGAGPGPVTP